MNWSMKAERENNKKHIRVRYRDGAKILEIDTTKVMFKSKPLNEHHNYYRRKFETNLLLEHMDEQRLPIKFCYSS